MHQAQAYVERLFPMPGGGGIETDVDIPRGAGFPAGVGFRGMDSVNDQLDEHPLGITIAHSVREGDGKSLDSQTGKIDDDPAAGRKWTPVEVNLSAYAGRKVTLCLEARSRWRIPPDGLVWSGSPRIALRSSAG